jgi:hypothetical protein
MIQTFCRMRYTRGKSIRTVERKFFLFQIALRAASHPRINAQNVVYCSPGVNTSLPLRNHQRR